MFLPFFIGKLVSKLKLPSILGWLIAGMILGPHALKLIPQDLMDGVKYQAIVHVLECAVGLMIGTELVWSRMKEYGKALIITTLTQSFGTFFLVSAVFTIIFAVSGIPIYLAFIFGGIALATAPAPALSIVREFQTDGPVTKTLIPMAALDDMVGVIVFFYHNRHCCKKSYWRQYAHLHDSGNDFPAAVDWHCHRAARRIAVKKKERSKPLTLFILIGLILVTAFIGFVCNTYLMRSPLLNFMLMGMAFSAAFSNLVTEERLEQIVREFNPFLSGSMVIVILNLGAPLDYHAILGAGLFTFIYILSRALGKYYGARLGAKATSLPDTVQKYLGFTLLPHSGVSLVFTGIAVSVLSAPAPECARIIQGTIAAAAVINEVIAVITAKKGFEWAGEFHGPGDLV